MRKTGNIDRDKLWSKIGYKPHSDEQRQFHKSLARFRAAICGRRFGKSTMAAVDLIEACFIPDSYFWICGPSYRLAEKEFRIVYRAFCDYDKLNMSKEIKKSYNAKQGDMRMEFPWHTVIECVSATNQESLIGEGLDGVIMSEAARHSLETWEAYIEPALSDRRGWATFPSTPKGFNWLQGMYQLGQEPDFPDYESWRYPTWLNSVRYPGGFDDPELQRVRRVVSPGFWKQEYAAEFTSFEGQIYEEFDPRYHVLDIQYQPLWKNYWVFDYGFSDPLVCLDIMVDPSDNVYVWREYMVRHKTTWEHAHELKLRQNPDGHHVDAMFGDPRGADEAATIALVLGQVFSQDVPWIQGIEAVKRWLKLGPEGKPKLFIDRSCTTLIRQMQALRHKEIKEGQNAREGQVDYDDHGPDALRYFFSQYFILGAGSSLRDAYNLNQRGSEAESFFSSRTKLTLDTNVGY